MCQVDYSFFGKRSLPSLWFISKWGITYIIRPYVPEKFVTSHQLLFDHNFGLSKLFWEPFFIQFRNDLVTNNGTKPIKLFILSLKIFPRNTHSYTAERVMEQERQNGLQNLQYKTYCEASLFGRARIFEF